MNRFELADAMIRGLHTPNVQEAQMSYINVSAKTGSCRACALGCALIGKYDGDYGRAEEVFDKESLENRGEGSIQGSIAHVLGIPTDLAIKIEHKHLDGMSIEQIAAWLKFEETEVKTI